MKTWFENAGFAHVYYVDVRVGLRLVADWSLNKMGNPVAGDLVHQLWTSLIAYGLTVGVNYDATFSLKNTNSTYLIL